MKKCYVLYALLLMITFGLISCEEDSDTTDPPEPSGDIIGQVTLYDLFRGEVSDKSGVTVEALTGDRKFTTTTNSAGEFSFTSVPQGDYIINFKKESYGGFDSLRFEHHKEVDSLFFAKLAEVPKGRIVFDRVYFGTSADGNEPLIFPTMTTAVESEEWVLSGREVFFSKDPKVSNTNFMYSYWDCCFGGSSQHHAKASPGIEYYRLYESGFKPGDEVYAVAYLGNSLNMWYNNPALGYNHHLFIASGGQPSNVVSFVMP